MRRALLAVGLAALLAVGAGAGWWFTRDTALHATVTDVVAPRSAPAGVQEAAPVARTVDAYAGLGAWADAFDYSPPYAGPNPVVKPTVVTDMHAAGVRTLFVQAARDDPKSPGSLEDRWLLAEFLLRAHQQGMKVVGWYLPKWSAGTTDLDHLEAIATFSVLGQRFDGVAVDIEYVADGLTPADRNARFLALASGFRQASGTDTIGAIVLPPVVTEVVNPTLWPAFPWAQSAPYYDVWLPMSYWSNRTTRSGYKDSFTYTDENVRRLRADLKLPAALVHPIGGIGALDGVNDPPNPTEPMASITDLDGYVRALQSTHAVGGSIYDWATTGPVARSKLQDLMRALGPAPTR